MARKKYFFHLLNDEGQPISGADISVYLAGTTTDVTIYTSKSSSNYEVTSPQLTTNQDGYCEFYIGDNGETHGYNGNQEFKIAFLKDGIVDGYNDYIQIFDHNPVDLTDTNTVKNKNISNSIGKLWEDHRTDETHKIHGITEVDETDTDTVKNKLVSNNQMKELTNRTFTSTVPSGSLSPSGAEYYYDIAHNFSDEWPIVFVYNSDTNESLAPNTILSVDENTIRVFFSSELNIVVKLNI